MNQKFIRVYRKINLDDIREHLIICGDLSASCSKCKEMGFIDLSTTKDRTEEINTAFPQEKKGHYTGFLNIFGKEKASKMDVLKCPSCGTDFKYLTFRNVKENMPKILKLSETHPDLVIVDFDDFKRMDSASKAQEFLG